MIVLYLKGNNQYILSIQGFPDVEEIGNKLYFKDGGVIINDLTKAGYTYYPDQFIEIPKVEDPDTGELVDAIVSVGDLNLQPFTEEVLPHSEHIAMLKSVTPSLVKPVTVIRRYRGVNYNIQCLAVQSVAELYQAGEIQIGDYMLVSFIDEIPNTTERSVAIVTAKIYKSW